MLRTGSAWLAARLAESASVKCMYVRGNTETEITATVGRSTFESQNQSGVVEQWESRDYIVTVGDLPYAEPERGDRIIEVFGDTETTFQVSAPRGVPLYHFSDAFRSAVRIHTVAMATTGVVPGTLLVRAVGAFAGSSITDQQIVASLTVEQATGRVMSRTLNPSAAYVYVVLPTSYGSPTFKVNGIVSTAWEATVRNITFTGQAARSYTIHRSTYAITGTLLLEVS